MPNDKLPGWTPFQPAKIPPVTMERRQAEIAAVIRDAGLSRAEATLRVNHALDALPEQIVWMNSRYQVNVTYVDPPNENWPRLVHLSIKRRDKSPLGPEHFRDLQRIKNELVGPECEAVELYPAESRLVDTANQYHLWVMDSTEFRYPFGFGDRLVMGESTGPSAKQQPFES